MSSEDNNSTANNRNTVCPIDTDDNPISFYDNPAHIEGAQRAISRASSVEG